MSNDDDAKAPLLKSRGLLDKFAWSREYRAGADESIDEPPIFGTDDWSVDLDDSLSVDFNWPSLEPSTKAAAKSSNPLPADTTNSIDGEAIPEKIVTERDLVWKRLSPDEGYLLGFVDGNTSLNDLADITGWETQTLNRAMARLMKVQVIRLK